MAKQKQKQKKAAINKESVEFQQICKCSYLQLALTLSTAPLLLQDTSESLQQQKIISVITAGMLRRALPLIFNDRLIIEVICESQMLNLCLFQQLKLDNPLLFSVSYQF